ncbi:hypothetical protein BG005_006305 [Podila minutissima]|nr:hypothetical protein BG005_006305 [Podila minutissima]
MTRLNVSRLDQTDFKQRIQELKSSLANRQHHVDGAQRVTAEQIELAHRTYGSEDPSVTVTESVVSNSIPQDSTLERSHEIGRDEEEDNTDSHDASATMENNEDDARDDLRNIRDEIHDMLATLERSKMESRQMQQWIVERSDLERQLREEWAITNSEAQRMEFEQDNFSSDASSEYRDPDNPENPVGPGNKAADDGSEGAQPTKNRRGLVGKRFPWRFVRICFWMLFAFALHVALMGLLFRPIALVEDGSRSVVADKNRREHWTHSIRYNGRDYISGQPGFYTFLSDGFGTDSLAYCHDMVHYPGHEDKSWGSSLLRFTLDSIDHAHAQWVSLSKVSWNGKPLQKKLQPLWSPFADRLKRMMRKKSTDETLDWVFAEQQAQAQ